MVIFLLGIQIFIVMVLQGDSREIAAHEFAKAMNLAKDELALDLQQLERLVVAPTTDLVHLLDHIKRILTKRSHKLLDYDRHGEALKSLKEKQSRTAADEKKMAQLEIVFDQASREYFAINNQIKDDLRVFLGLRTEFIDPILLTFYTYQVCLSV